MFQFLPALILLLLQGQGYGNRIGSQHAFAAAFPPDCYRAPGPGHLGIRDVRRQLIVRFLVNRGDDSPLARHLIKLFQAIDASHAAGPVFAVNRERKSLSVEHPDFQLHLVPLSSSQRLRDGPSIA